MCPHYISDKIFIVQSSKSVNILVMFYPLHQMLYFFRWTSFLETITLTFNVYGFDGFEICLILIFDCQKNLIRSHHIFRQLVNLIFSSLLKQPAYEWPSNASITLWLWKPHSTITKPAYGSCKPPFQFKRTPTLSGSSELAH